MKIVLKNLGPLRQAEFCLGDMTIVCGKNNTGKTYATYAIYGFLTFWKEVFHVDLPADVVRTLQNAGVVQVNLHEYVERFQEILDEACKQFRPNLPIVLGAQERNFENTEFCIQVGSSDIQPIKAFEKTWSAPKRQLFQISKSPDEDTVKISLLVEQAAEKIPVGVLRRMIGDALKEIIFGHLFPEPFIASAERTGAAIFRNDLNFTLSQVFDQLKETQDLNPFDVIDKAFHRHALPVVRNVEFMRRLEDTAKTDSFIMREQPAMLARFSDIIGGEYKIVKDGLYFTPSGARVRLTMKEGSSAVRSLLDLGFFIRHVAERGQLLMIDEPELNLHPENQRRVARLLARLVNLGIRVYMTTHSDYIIKEINTLMMLNRDLPHLQKIVEKHGYCKEELLLASRVKAYVAQTALVAIDGQTRRSRIPTFISCEVTQDMGIDAKSFDPTILQMNRIQEDIILGKDA